MRELTPNELSLVGAGRCGNRWQAMFIEGTCGLAGGFIGAGVSVLNPVAAYYGATAGFMACKLLCRC